MLVYLGGALGVNTFLMKGYFDTIPVDIDESARIDGAGHVRIFFGLILRLSMPILVVVFFVSFQSTFNELPIAPVVLPDRSNTTLAVGLNGLVSNPLDPAVGPDGRRRRDGRDPAGHRVPHHPAVAGHRPDRRRVKG